MYKAIDPEIDQIIDDHYKLSVNMYRSYQGKLISAAKKSASSTYHKPVKQKVSKFALIVYMLMMFSNRDLLEIGIYLLKKKIYQRRDPSHATIIDSFFVDNAAQEESMGCKDMNKSNLR